MNQHTPPDEFQLPAIVPTQGPPKPLSNVEVDALKSLAEGLTIKETAYLNGVTESAIKHRIFRAKKKLSARTTTHCVTIAFGLGLFLLKPAE